MRMSIAVGWFFVRIRSFFEAVIDKKGANGRCVDEYRQCLI